MLVYSGTIDTCLPNSGHYKAAGMKVNTVGMGVLVCSYTLYVHQHDSLYYHVGVQGG